MLINDLWHMVLSMVLMEPPFDPRKTILGSRPTQKDLRPLT